MHFEDDCFPTCYPEFLKILDENVTLGVGIDGRVKVYHDTFFKEWNGDLIDHLMNMANFEIILQEGLILRRDNQIFQVPYGDEIETEIM